jgi:hypothetical protein
MLERLSILKIYIKIFYRVTQKTLQIFFNYTKIKLFILKK